MPTTRRPAPRAQPRTVEESRLALFGSVPERTFQDQFMQRQEAAGWTGLHILAVRRATLFYRCGGSCKRRWRAPKPAPGVTPPASIPCHCGGTMRQEVHSNTPIQGRAGFPDYVGLRLEPDGRVRHLVAELKRVGGRPTPEQRHWLELYRAQGAEVYIWTPADWPEIERVMGLLT